MFSFKEFDKRLLVDRQLYSKHQGFDVQYPESSASVHDGTARVQFFSHFPRAFQIAFQLEMTIPDMNIVK